MDIYEVAERPWGEWKVVHVQDEFTTVKILTVSPGQMLSLQRHAQRDEYWIPLESGLMKYTDPSGSHMPSVTQTGGEYMVARKTYFVPMGTAHRLVNPTATAISVIEIIKGRYDEEDIVRLHDSYDRT